jgi:AraC family transcriptional regulator, regulatory protein of adaptative response / DNA-3-methyladenine glycosylase II
MTLDRRTCDRARLARDARFDGWFFSGVRTTRIYCRPTCPVKPARSENVIFFPTAAAAERAGFRPCLRCRPEAAPGTPAWSGTSGIVSRALRFIGEGALDVDGVERLADRLGVTSRHLRRLFVQHLGATPLEVALTRRVHFAKKLLDETTLSCTEVAFASGFGSLRRFNGQIRRTYGRAPTALRRLARKPELADPTSYRFRLAFRPPYDWPAIAAFLHVRATPGVEFVDAAHYRRTIVVDGKAGIIDVTPDASGRALTLDVRFPDPRSLLFIVEQVRRMFDLGADPALIAGQLGSDRLLRPLIDARPGVRVPGAWNGFELAVRAIIGQQISVRAATTVTGRIAEMFGSLLPGDEEVGRLFPTPSQLEYAAIEGAGIIAARAATIRALARAVLRGTIRFGSCADTGEVMAALRALPGIGAWTAEYIAMRALNEPDAFPTGDLVLRRAAGNLSANELERRSEAWRPWRAYAVMLLWHDASFTEGLRPSDSPTGSLAGARYPAPLARLTR